MKPTAHALIARLTTCALLAIPGAIAHTSGSMAASGDAARSSDTSSAAPERAGNRLQLKELIGMELRDLSDRKIGTIESVMVGDGGKRLLVVGVEGYVKVPERAVIPLGWREMRLMADKGIIRMPMSEAQMAAMPDYDYPAPGLHGTVYQVPRTRPGKPTGG